MQTGSTPKAVDGRDDVGNAVIDAELGVLTTSSVRTQPGTMSTKVRRSPSCRASYLRMNVFKAALLPR